jgi:hypothetical protein
VDPAVSETQAPYSYVGDDPLNRTDPLGLCWPSWACGVENSVGSVASSAVNTVASVSEDAVQDVGELAVDTATWVGQHPLQTIAIVGGAGLTVYAGGMIWEAGLANVAEEGTIVGGLENVDLAIHAPFVLLPGITLSAIGALGVGWGGYSSLSGQNGGSTPCR